MQREEWTIALCDDERDFLASLAPQVKSILDDMGIDCTVLPYCEAETLLKDIHDGRQLSLLLADVMMPGLDGMALTRELRREAIDLPVIFVSSNRETALYGYELDALRFLSKPVETERLREALCAAREKLQTQALAIRTQEGLYRLDVRNLGYAEMLRRGVVLHLRDGTALTTRMQIGELETQLPPRSFFRCHQGYIVNVGAISAIQKSDAVLLDGARVPVSRYRMTALREHFLAYLKA